MYSSRVFGYADFSKAQTYQQRVMDPEQVRARLLATKYPKDLVEHMLHADQITLDDVGDWCELDAPDSRKLISFLVRKHAIYRGKRSSYTKTSEFIRILKELSESGLPEASIPEEGTEF